MNVAFRLSNRFICMITKNSWYKTRDTPSNVGFNLMKEYLLQQGTLVKVVDFPKYHEVFKGVGCSVSYFLADKSKSNREYNFVSIVDGQVVSNFTAKSITTDLLRDKELTSIAGKTTSSKNLSEFTKAKLAFGIDTTGVFNDSIIKTQDYSIRLIGNNIDSYISPNDVSRNEDLNEAINAVKYLKTRFVRELLRCTIDARGVISGITFEYVPTQNFTSNSDIDWSKPISEIDQQLDLKIWAIPRGNSLYRKNYQANGIMQRPSGQLTSGPYFVIVCTDEKWYNLLQE